MNCHFCKEESKFENIHTPICDRCLRLVWGETRGFMLNPQFGEGGGFWDWEKPASKNQLKYLFSSYQGFDYDGNNNLKENERKFKNHVITVNNSNSVESCTCGKSCVAIDRFEKLSKIIQGDAKRSIRTTKLIALCIGLKGTIPEKWKEKMDKSKKKSPLMTIFKDEQKFPVVKAMSLEEICWIPPEQINNLWNPRINIKNDETIIYFGREIKKPAGYSSNQSNTNSSGGKISFENLDGGNWPDILNYDAVIRKHRKTNFNEFKNADFKFRTKTIPDKRVGQFAVVYIITINSQRKALRMFIAKKPDITKRYDMLSKYFKNEKIWDSVESFIKFRYLEEEITIKKNIEKNGKSSKHDIKFPVIEMDWIEGKNLGDYVKDNFKDKQKMAELSQKFLKIIRDLERNNIAHGDLHPLNIMINSNGEMKIIDYDCVFIPSFKGQSSPESGQEDFQHPSRFNPAIKNFPKYDEKLDRFSALVIYLSLKAIEGDHTIYDKKRHESILFSKNDYVEIQNDRMPDLVKKLQNQNGIVKDLTDELIKSCKQNEPTISKLDDIINRKK